MAGYISYILVLILLVQQCQFAILFRNEEKDAILLELLNELSIRYVIITTNDKLSVRSIKESRRLSAHFLSVKLENLEDLEKLVIQKQIPNVKTCLVFKENSSEVINILNRLKQVSILRYVKFDVDLKWMKINRSLPSFRPQFIFENIYKLNISCGLKEIDELHLASKFTWIIFMKKCLTEDSSKTYNVPYDCEFVIVCPKNSTTFQLLETFKFKAVASVIDLGMWDTNSGLTISEKFFYDRRMDFNSTVLNLKTIDPALMCSYESACHIAEYLYYIATKLNFRFHLLSGFYTPEDIDLLKEAEFYQNAVPFHADFKTDTSKMIAPILRINIDWYIKYPSVEQQGDYFRPFHRSLWTAILSTIIVGTLTIVVSACIKQNFGSREESISYVDYAFSAFDCFLNQDGTRNKPFKIIACTLRFTSMFTTAAYSARIISFLAQQIPDIPFRNLDEFIENGEYVLARSAENFSDVYINDRQNPAMQIVKEKFSRNLQEHEIPDAICKDKVAALVINTLFEVFEKKCKLLRVGEPLERMFTAILMPTGSPFTKVCNYLLLVFYSAGISHRYETRVSDYVSGEITVDKNLYPVALSEIAQILLIVMLGIVCAASFFICELILKNCPCLKSAKICKKSTSKMRII